MNPITFVLMVKNGEATLQKTLEALKNWPHVLVLDTGSTDNTLKIIKKFPHITLHETPFKGFGQTRNIAAQLAQTPWVFHIDADEIPTSTLLAELKELVLDPHTVYAVKRDNYFWGKHMKGCSGWYPDFVTRLYHKKTTSYSLDLVHEKVLDKALNVQRLKGSLRHTPYQSLAQMLAKMNHYSDLFVLNTHKKASRLSPYIHGLHAFIKSYLLKGGWTQGYRGLILSKYIADTAFYKYLKLYEKSKSD